MVFWIQMLDLQSSVSKAVCFKCKFNNIGFMDTSGVSNVCWYLISFFKCKCISDIMCFKCKLILV